ncbi:hypothetical protein RIR_jg3770.t1 [Rhizophagus irregularis DAOM 181602=DAOM 197198]|nr:hypothetical protein RIR_jg3770.t1 [Rhizophagus irregularis DAOM 181602=DAOM 197198]
MIGCFTSSYYSWNLLRREYRIYKKCIVILDKNFLESRENDEEPNLQIIRHVLLLVTSKVSKFPADAGTGHGIFGRLKNAANIMIYHQTTYSLSSQANLYFKIQLNLLAIINDGNILLKTPALKILNSRYKNQKKFEFYIATVQIKHDNNVLFIKSPQIFGSKFLVQIIQFGRPILTTNLN